VRVTLVSASRVIEPRAVPTASEVVVKSGSRIVVPPGFDEDTLRRVVAVLEARPC
jgi:hypothetical protein